MKHAIFIIVVIAFTSIASYSQNVAIELEGMNILYIGVDNPINIAVENHSCEDIVVKTNAGKLTKTSDECRYIYRTDSCDLRTETISVGVKSNGNIKWIDSTLYRVKNIPNPEIRIATNRNSHNNYSAEITRGGLIATMGDFDFYFHFEVQRYSVEVLRNDSIIFKEYNVKGNGLSKEFISLYKNSHKGDYVRFFDCLIKGPSKCDRIIDGPIFTLN